MSSQALVQRMSSTVPALVAAVAEEVGHTVWEKELHQTMVGREGTVLGTYCKKETMHIWSAPSESRLEMLRNAGWRQIFPATRQ